MDDLQKRLRFRDWDEYDLVTDTDVDKFNLDLCAETHSHNVLKWQELLTQAEERFNKAKEALTYVESKLTLQARSDGVPGIDKLTDAVVKSWVVTQEEYRLKLKAKIKAETDVSHIKGGIKALDSSREMIKIEANLWVCGYYSRPHIKESVSSEQQEQRKTDTAAELKKALAKRKRREAEEN